METWIWMIVVSLLSGCGAIFLLWVFQKCEEMRRPLYGKKVLIFCENVDKKLCGINLLSEDLKKRGAHVFLSSDPYDNPENQNRYIVNIAIVVATEEIKIGRPGMFVTWEQVILDGETLQHCRVLNGVIQKVLELIA